MHEHSELDAARDAISRADFTEALELLSRLVAADPANREAWRELGVCYLETRQPATAIDALSRSVAAGATDATVHLLLGHAYGSVGQLESAAACYRRALEVEPSHVKAEEFLIRTESLLESREHYRNALKCLYRPEPSANDLNHAVRSLVHSIAIFSGSPARDNLRECARKLLTLKTERQLDEGVPPELAPWVRACERGYHCIAAGNWAGARAAYDEALAYRADDAFVHHALGFCFVETEETDEAVRAWLRVIELEPEYDFTGFGRPGRRG